MYIIITLIVLICYLLFSLRQKMIGNFLGEDVPDSIMEFRKYSAKPHPLYCPGWLWCLGSIIIVSGIFLNYFTGSYLIGYAFLFIGSLCGILFILLSRGRRTEVYITPEGLYFVPVSLSQKMVLIGCEDIQRIKSFRNGVSIFTLSKVIRIRINLSLRENKEFLQGIEKYNLR